MATKPTDHIVSSSRNTANILSDAMVEKIARLSYAEHSGSLTSQIGHLHVMFTRLDRSDYPNEMGKVIAEGGFEPLSTVSGQKRMYSVPDERLALLMQAARMIEKDRSALADPTGGSHMFGDLEVMRERGTAQYHEKAGFTVGIDDHEFFGGNRKQALAAHPLLKEQLSALDVDKKYLRAAIDANERAVSERQFQRDTIDMMETLGLNDGLLQLLFALAAAWLQSEDPEAWAMFENMLMDATGERNNATGFNSAGNNRGNSGNGRFRAEGIAAARDIGSTTQAEVNTFIGPEMFKATGRYQLYAVQTGVHQTGAAKVQIVLADPSGEIIFSAVGASGGAGNGPLPGLDDGNGSEVITTKYGIDWQDFRINRQDRRGRAGMSYTNGDYGYSISLINADNMQDIGGAGRGLFRIHPAGKSSMRNLGCLEFNYDADARKFLDVMSSLPKNSRPLDISILDPNAAKKRYAELQTLPSNVKTAAESASSGLGGVSVSGTDVVEVSTGLSRNIEVTQMTARAKTAEAVPAAM